MITVTAPATHKELTTLAMVKAELGIEGAEADALITGYIQQATAAVETYCDRMLAKATVTETIRAYGNPLLMVSVTPVTELAEISWLGDDRTATVIPADEYWLEDDQAGLIRRLPYGRMWTWTATQARGLSQKPVPGTEAHAWQVSYSGGYVMPTDPSGLRTLPPDIERAALHVIKNLYYGARRDPSVTEEAVPDVYSAKYAKGSDATPPAVVAQAQGLLARHRRLV